MFPKLVEIQCQFFPQLKEQLMSVSNGLSGFLPLWCQIVMTFTII